MPRALLAGIALLLALVLVADAGAATPGRVNLALNTSGAGLPSPLASDRGWGGGARPWEILDGKASYKSWQHGLAFTGGKANYVEPAGPRQATIDLGKVPKTFDAVVAWHHGQEHVPADAKLEYFDGIAWIPIAYKRTYPGVTDASEGYGSTADTYAFAPVTGTMVRWSIDNRDLNYARTQQIEHGWLYELEVLAANQPQKDTTAPSIALTSPVDGARHRIGEPVEAAYSCTDEATGSGIDACTGTVPAGAPVDTTAGVKTFTVTARDKAGNERTASVTYTVENGSEEPGKCQTRIDLGATVELRATCFRRQDDGTYLASGTVKVNGFRIDADADALIGVDPSTAHVFTRGHASVFLGKWKLHRGSLDWDGFVGFDLDITEAPKLGGFPLTGKPKVTFNSKRSHIAVRVKLPSYLSGVEASGELVASNDRGLHAESVRLKVNRLPLGPLAVRDLDLEYSNVDVERWRGSGMIMLPGLLDVELATAFADGDFQSGRAAIDGLNTPTPVPGVFLQRLRLELVVRPGLSISGGIGVSAGPRVLGAEAVSLDGDFRYTDGHPGPSRYDLTGAVKLVEIPLANARATYRTDGHFSFSGRMQWGKGGFGFTGDASGFVYRRDFNAEVHGKLTTPIANLGGDGLVSSKGVAACGKLKIGLLGHSTSAADAAEGAPVFSPELTAGPHKLKLKKFFKKVERTIRKEVDRVIEDLAKKYLTIQASVGFGYTWGGAFKLMARHCDVGDWRVADPGMHAATSGGELSRTTKLPSGLTVAAFSATGTDRVPRLTLIGPNGRKITTPADPSEGNHSAGALILKDRPTRTVYIAVSHPAGGTWRMRTMSAGARQLRVANGLPPVVVRGRVVRREGTKRRTLVYALRAIPGQAVTFVERAGDIAREIKTTRRSHGQIEFTPMVASGRHTVEAIVEQFGLPRVTVPVARYTPKAR